MDVEEVAREYDLTREDIQAALSFANELVDPLLSSFEPPEPEIDREWAAVARDRLAEMRSGKVKSVPGEQVFEKIGERFGQ